MAFSECDYIDPSEPLRQGDVLRSLDPAADPWDAYVIVVTADCDIARDKHGGRLTCVPVLPLRSYLASYYLPRRISKVADAMSERLVGMMRKAQKENLADFNTAISRERADAWLVETSPARVAETLRIAEKDYGTFLELAQQLVVIKSLAPGDFDGYRDAFTAAQIAMKPATTRGAVRESLRNELVAHTKDLPGDALFLSSLGEELDAGYVAYLRVLQELREGCVALKSSQQSFEMTHERIARVKAPYVYALTQQLGAVFSAIGLPTEYEQTRVERSQMLVEDEEEIGA
jgi:hypothetical protein